MGQLRISPKRIFVSGEKLTAEMEGQIHQAWAAPVIDSYSASESRFIAWKQSGDTAMNIIDELNILEILDSDSRQVGIGQSGRAVLTNLYNATLPLIRYEMGDYLVCGAPNFASPIKTIKEISGRTTAALPVRLRDGSEGRISQIVLALFYVPHLEKVQFVSLRQDRVQIRYVSAENLDRSVQNEFQRFLDRLGATRTTFEVCRVARIDPDSHTGKYSFVVVPELAGFAASLPQKDPIAMDGRACEPVSFSTSVTGSARSPSQSMPKKTHDIAGLPPDQENILRKCFHPSGGAVQFAEADVETSIPARFAAIVRLYGERPAVIAGNRRLTYAELNRASNRVARAILAQRGSVNEPIALLLQTDANALIAILGILKAGKAYVPLEVNEPPARLSFMLRDSQAPLIITDASMFPVLQAIDSLQRPVLDIDKVLAEFDEADLDCATGAGEMAYIMYTSGSTGMPKGVLQNHRNILHKVFTHTHDFRICAEDRLSLLYSYSFSASVRCIFSAFLNGAALVPGDVRREGLDQVAKRIIAERVTLYFSVPSLFRDLATALAGLKKPCPIRLIYLASETVGKQDVDLYKRCFGSDCILVHSLSTGETGTVRQYFISKTTEVVGNLVPVGYAVRHQEVLLLDEQRALSEWNGVGEIAIRSRFLSPGYWQRPELTQAKFLEVPGDPDARIYLTGDLGVMRPDGCLEYHGRKDFQVKIRGNNVSVGEIEAMLRKVNGVTEAVVVSREKSPGETHLVAYVVPDGHTSPTAGALRRALADWLPGPMIPSAFVILDALPMTANGKIDRLRLPDPGNLRPALDNPYTLPHTPMETALSAIWANVLALDRVGVEDNFFDLGGHSLGAARILARVGEAFHVDLSVKALFDRPTVAGMAQAILAEQASRMDEQLIDQILSEVEALGDGDG
jgi:amino acid adenylation domain-containing protein